MAKNFRIGPKWVSETVVGRHGPLSNLSITLLTLPKRQQPQVYMHLRNQEDIHNALITFLTIIDLKLIFKW